ncbi:MAG: hypothetical protein LBP87_06540 [Planctomycetaceae bacterium]|jgi:hypothetical protein|nr:hypothetical protein [Planctomycetaceae bacterium]
MKTGKIKLYELYDIDGKKSITYSRREAKNAFKRGFIVIEYIFLSCQTTRYIKSTTVVTKQWLRHIFEQ